MSASGSKLPPVQWAQRSDKLWLTIDLQEAHDPQIKLQNQDDHGKLSFQGAALSHAAEAEPQQYALELDLYGKIDEEASKISVSARKIVLVIAKAESGHWPRLLQKPGKGATNIKVDWDKWVDEDEEEEGGKDDFDTEGLTNMSNFDLGGPGGMQEMMAKMQAGGMGGMGGMGGGPPGAGGMGGFGGMGGASPDAGGFGGMGGLGDDFGSGDLGAGGAGPGIEEDSEDDEPPPLPTSS